MCVAEGKTPDRLPIWASKHNKDGFKADTTERMIEKRLSFKEI